MSPLAVPAADLLTWDHPSDNPASTWNSDSNASSVQPSAITTGPGVGIALRISTEVRYDLTQAADFADAQANGVYLEFTVTPNTAIDIESIRFIGSSNKNKLLTGELRSSADGYSTTLAKEYFGNTTGSGTPTYLKYLGFQNVTSPITFRLYFYGGLANQNFFIVDDPSSLAPFVISDTNPQVPALTPRFPHDQTLEVGRLYARLPNESRTTVLAYHNGYIYAQNVGGANPRELEFTDPSDPSSLAHTGRPTPPFMDAGHGTHAYAKTGEFLGTQIRYISDGVNYVDSGFGNPRKQLFATQNFPGGESIVQWPWRLGFEWTQYSGNNITGQIHRGEELIANWDEVADHGITSGVRTILGNLLFVMADDTKQGVAVYDISPTFEDAPQDPQLLDAINGPEGAYIGMLWRNYIVLWSRVDDRCTLIDYSDPTNLTIVDRIDVLQNGSVPYVQFQDEYAFAWGTKVNLETREIELMLDWDDDGVAGNPDFEDVYIPRPAGSPSGECDPSQFNLPLGNLLLTGPFSATDKDAIGVWAHQAEPDTRSPFVAYHMPRQNTTDYPVGAPVSLMIHETLESPTIVYGESIMLREVATGELVSCWHSFGYDDILTLTPYEWLKFDTEYEVVVPAGGIKDAAGNGIIGYSFTFRTKADTPSNLPPEITSFDASTSPVDPGQSVTFTASAFDPDGSATLEYRFTAGDGSASTAWTSQTSFTHTYTSSGHFSAKIQVREVGDTSATATVSYTLTVAPAISGNRPTTSSHIVLDAVAGKLWMVNPDNDTVTRLNAVTDAKELEIDLRALLASGDQTVDPRAIAQDSSGNLWVACYDADAIVVLDSSGNLVETIGTGYGSAPIGIVSSPDGSTVYTTIEARGGATQETLGNGGLLSYDASSRNLSGSLALGPTPRGIAVTADGSRVLVTRFISGATAGQIWDVDAASLTLNQTYFLSGDQADRTGNKGPGVPNYVASVTIDPQGQFAWYTAVKVDSINGSLFLGDMTHDQTVRAMVGRIELSSNAESLDHRIDIDNADSPVAVTFSDRGDYAFVALQGSNQISIFDNLELVSTPASETSKSQIGRIRTDLAPQAIVSDFATNKIITKNLMGRSATVHNLTNFFQGGDLTPNRTDVVTVANERMTADVLLGKQIFYNAADEGGPNGVNRMSFESYISCASCHVDGSQDGVVWDFTQRGEGLRNTVDLRGRRGMGHGNVHWSGNFDEIEDFLLDIVNQFDGTGFPHGVTPNAPLGEPNAGDPEMAALAAYLTSLGNSSLPRSPYRGSDGGLTTEALAGKAVFESAGMDCMSCHSGPDYTDSMVGLGNLHDVGTIRSTSGQRLDSGPLPGVDTPTLLGVWNTAPYLHDGAARSLSEVFRQAGGVTIEAESGNISGGSLYSGITLHGQQGVELDSSGDTLSLSGIDGGSGGTGALTIRAGDASTSGGQAVSGEVRVNGTAYALNVPASNADQYVMTVFIENVTLTQGTSNTIEIESTTGDNLLVDNVTVSTADDLAAADAHRRVLALNETDQNNLVEYVRQIDGRIEFASGVPVITTTALPDVGITVPYSVTVQSLGGEEPLTWSLSGAPSWLSIDPNTGELSGTPTSSGTFNFDVIVTDANSDADTESFSLTVNAIPAIVEASGGSPITVSGGSSSFSGVTVPDVANRVLVVTVGSESGAQVSAMTFGGQSLTQAAAISEGASHVSIWYLVNPPATTASINASWPSNPFNGPSMAYYVVSGIEQSNPIAATGSDSVSSGSSTSVTLTGAPSASFAVDAITTNNNVTSSLAWGGGQTESWADGGLGGGATHATSFEVDTSSNPTQTVSFNNTRAAYVAVAFSPITGGGSTNLTPIAEAGPNQTVTDSDGNGSESVTLDGTGSSDSDGTIVSYVWEENSTQLATGATPSVSLGVGVHTITLTVEDDEGATDSDTVVITVNAAANNAPVADAGPDQTVTDGDDSGSESVSLNGSASSDSDGTLTSYVWTEGGSQIATGVAPTVSLGVGTHTISLTVTDDDGASDTDTLVVTVNPAPGGSTLYADDFSDNDISDWTVQSGSTNWSASNGQLIFPNNTGGENWITYDNGFGWSDYTFEFQMSSGDDDPQGGFVYYVDNNNFIAFYGTLTFNGGPAWRLVQRVAGTETIVDEIEGVSYAQGETVDVSISVTNGGSINVTASDPVNGTVNLSAPTPAALSGGTIGFLQTYQDPAIFDNIVVSTDSGPGNLAPVADAGPDQNVPDSDGSGGENVALDGSGSSDSDGTIVSYVWEEGGSQIATGANPTVGLSVGTHTIDLTVTDDGGATGTDTVVITVDSLPTITTASLPDGEVNVAYSALLSSSGGDAPISWTMAGAPAWLNLNANTGDLSGTPTSAGATDVTFFATDADGDADSALLTISVTPEDTVPQITTTTLPNATQGADYSASVSSTGGNGTLSWSLSGAPAWLGIDPDTGELSGTPTSSGGETFDVTVSDVDNDSDTASLSLTVDPAPPTSMKLATGVVLNTDSTWQTVTLAENYSSMVVVASVAYGSTADATAVPRVRNASGNSFELKVQDPNGFALSGGYRVHYLVLEEGIYTPASDGVTLEALKVTSTGTSFKNTWSSADMEFVSPSNSYTNLVVLGQVMTENDPNWSVFWSSDGSQGNPASGSSIYVGKHVGEDPVTSRANETLGVILLEAGSGTIDGFEYSASTGADTVQGMGNTPPFGYALTGLSSASTAVVSSAAMDGSDGGWAALFGTSPVSTANLDLVIDEDQLSDSERGHTTEQVAYVVLGGGPSADASTVGLVDATARLGHVPFDVDVSDNDGNLTLGLSGGAAIESGVGQFEGAVRLNGGTDLVTIADQADFNNGNAPFQQRTISLWFALDTTSGRQLLFEEGGGIRGLNLYVDGTTLYAGGWDRNLDGDDVDTWPGTWRSVEGISAGQWYHVALVLDATADPTRLNSGAFRAYLDGVEFDVSNDLGMQLWNHGDDGGLGGVNGGSLYHDGTAPGTLAGYLDDFAVWNRALTAAEVSTLCNGQ
ncbi:MAG: PKD domain-containing protein [Opitutales bacterium]